MSLRHQRMAAAGWHRSGEIALLAKATANGVANERKRISAYAASINVAIMASMSSA